MDCLGKIEQASGHLLKLINEVLNMSKIESGRMELIEKPILIHSVVDNVLMLLQDNIEKKKMTLQVDMDRRRKSRFTGTRPGFWRFCKSGVERRQIYAGGRDNPFSRGKAGGDRKRPDISVCRAG